MSYRRRIRDRVHEAGEPEMVVGLLDADAVAGEDLTKVDRLLDAESA